MEHVTTKEVLEWLESIPSDTIVQNRVRYQTCSGGCVVTHYAMHRFPNMTLFTDSLGVYNADANDGNGIRIASIEYSIARYMDAFDISSAVLTAEEAVEIARKVQV